jgi:tetratricopeptide (TPR) repeat protein
MNNLGVVRLEQKRFDEAIEIFNKVLPVVETLEEPRNVAMVLQQIAEAFGNVGQIDQAEHFFRRALAIQVQQQSNAGEADVMIQMGVMYDEAERLEEAIVCGQRAAEIYVKLSNQMAEGAVRNNLGITFLKLRRFDDARRELLRAIECNKPFGHSGRLWNSWGHLHNLERVVGNAAVAAEARRNAVESYMAYRRDGGETLTQYAAIYSLVTEGIKHGNLNEMEQQLAARAKEATHPHEIVLIAKLQMLISGNRSPQIADDPNLDHRDAVELILLLESLEEQ